MAIANITSYDLLIWLAICWLFSRIYPVQRPEYQFGKYEWRYKPLFAVVVFLPIFIMTVFGPPRSDTGAYLLTFRKLPSSLNDAWRDALSKENAGFTLFGVAIKQIFGENETAYRFVIALIHSIPIIAVIRKYSVNYLLSIYLFITTTIHLGWMMNGLRQFMAVTIIFAATPWIIQKKYLRSIIVILIAATFHRTALVMIPVIFIVQGRVWNAKTIFYSIVIVIATYIFSRSSNAFDAVANLAGYSLNAVREWGDDGANPIRVLVNAVPMLMAYIYREQLATNNNPEINICINMSVVTTGIYLVAMVTSGILTGRMPIYTSLYNLILLPYIIDKVFTGSKRYMIMSAAIVLHYLFFLRSIGILL